MPDYVNEFDEVENDDEPDPDDRVYDLNDPEDSAAFFDGMFGDEDDPEDDDEESSGLEKLLDNLREREVGSTIAALFTPEAQEARAEAWAAYYAAQAEKRGKDAQTEEGWRVEVTTPEELPQEGPGSGGPLCPACGWSIYVCDVHDEEELKIIRQHDEGDHTECDPDGCVVAMQELIDQVEDE